jgi:hypothetical protein
MSMTELKEFTFNFRTTKDDQGVEYKRDSVIINLPVPSTEGLKAYIDEGGNEYELLQNAIEDTIAGHVRTMLGNDSTLTSETFPVDKVSWELIANQPATDRRGRGIAKELWDGFIESYCEVMPGVIDRPLDTVKKQASHLANKFQVLKTHEKKNELLPRFVEMLALYVNAAPDAEKYSAPVQFLLNKAEEFMQEDKSADLVDALGF